MSKTTTPTRTKRATAKQFLEEFAADILSATDVPAVINGYAKLMQARELAIKRSK